MTVIELPQGRHPSYKGMTREELLHVLHERDKERWAEHPDWYHEPSWKEIDVPDDATAPWGNEWYAVGADGRLFLHSENLDSSG